MTHQEAGRLGNFAAKKWHESRSSKIRAAYARDPKQCPRCSTSLSYDKRDNNYCSHSCAAIGRNVKTGLWCRSQKTPCEVCGKPSGRGGVYCSGDCHRQSKYDAYIRKWKAGEVNGASGKWVSISDYIHKYLRETRGNKCEKCGWAERSPVTNKVMVQLNHIDGDALHNREENLELLCPNCHSLTPNYMGLNKNNSQRIHRRLLRPVSIDGDARGLYPR